MKPSNTIKKISFILSVAVVSVFAETDDVNVNISAYLKEYYDPGKAKEVARIIQESSNGKCTENETRELVCTMSEEELVKIIEQDSIKGISVLKFPRVNGEFGAVGITVREQPQKTFTVLKVFKATPADNKLRSGDEILEIDGVDATTLTLDELAQKLRGKPNTPVTLKVLRGNETLTKTLTRSIIKIQNEEMIVSNKDGYLQIAIESFDQRFSDKLANILTKYPSKKLTIDLRNSNGGNFSAILSTLSLFLPSNQELFYTLKEGEKEIHSTPFISSPKILTPLKYTNEVEIIVDETTQAGSLLFAYAMAKYYPRCTLVGDKSGEFGYLYVGIGLPQRAGDMDYALKIATGQFYTMEGKVLSGKKLFDVVKMK